MQPFGRTCRNMRQSSHARVACGENQSPACFDEGRGGVTELQSRWAARTSADQTHSPAESQPSPGSGRRPGCVCTAGKDRRQIKHTWPSMIGGVKLQLPPLNPAHRSHQGHSYLAETVLLQILTHSGSFKHFHQTMQMQTHKLVFCFSRLIFFI